MKPSKCIFSSKTLFKMSRKFQTYFKHTLLRLLIFCGELYTYAKITGTIKITNSIQAIVIQD